MRKQLSAVKLASGSNSKSRWNTVQPRGVPTSDIWKVTLGVIGRPLGHPETPKGLPIALPIYKTFEIAFEIGSVLMIGKLKKSWA